MKENIHAQIRHVNINDHDIKYVGNLTTYRLEKATNNVTLVLDYSQYNGQEDYELEIEAPSYEQGEAFLKEILQHYSIKQSETENKIQRFFNTLS